MTDRMPSAAEEEVDREVIIRRKRRRAEDCGGGGGKFAIGGGCRERECGKLLLFSCRLGGKTGAHWAFI